MTDPQPFQGFTAWRASQSPSDQPSTPIRCTVPSFALGLTNSTTAPSRPMSPLQPIPIPAPYSPNNPFSQSTSLYQTPTQRPLQPGSAPVPPSVGCQPSTRAGSTPQSDLQFCLQPLLLQPVPLRLVWTWPPPSPCSPKHSSSRHRL